MPEARKFGFVPKSFEIGEPKQFVWGEVEPICQRADRLDGRNVPHGGSGNRLHPLRIVDPSRDRKVIGILGSRALKTGVVENELDYVALTGTRLAGDGFQVAPRERRQPSP